MKTKRLLTFFLVILLLSIISILYNPNPTSQATKSTAPEYPLEEAILERVIDGDTIVYRIGNICQSCRLLGINNTEV